MELCRVTGYILSPDSTPITNAQVEISMTKIDTDGPTVIVPNTVIVEPDENGFIDVNLWPNAVGYANTIYIVRIVGYKNKFQPFHIVVPEQATANLAEISNVPISNVVDTVKIYVALAETYKDQAQEAAADAANSAASISAGTINVGEGLVGGGSITANVTISLSANTVASLAKADSALQPGGLANVAITGDYADLINTPALANVATSGAYADLTGKPVLGTAASANSSDFATAAQGTLATTAVQPNTLSTVATSGAYNDLTGKPTLGTAASANANTFATAAQGAKADTAVQPGSLATVATSGSYNDLSNRPTLGTAASQNANTFATAAQGVKADTAVQPNTLATVATTGSYTDLINVPAPTPITADSITDATTTGKNVLKAADQAAARAAIGAGTSNLTLGTTGTTALAGNTPLLTIGTTTAKAGNYQPTAANITDATAVGRSVLTAADANTARTAIGAGGPWVQLTQAEYDAITTPDPNTLYVIVG